jgi:hypothetical protein
MKYIVTMALMLSLGVASAYAHERSVKMTSSGTAAGSTVDLKIPDTTTGENDFAGNGTLGSYTFREIEAETGPQTPPSTCSGANNIYNTVVAGAGVFRFQDGSLLNVTLTDGTDCIDLAANQAHCTRNFKILSGTGRFKDASQPVSSQEQFPESLTKRDIRTSRNRNKKRGLCYHKPFQLYPEPMLLNESTLRFDILKHSSEAILQP